MILALLMLMAWPRSASAQAPTGPTGVYYVGPEDAIADAIDLAAPYLVRVGQSDLAQVIVINNAPLRDSLEVFSNEIQQGRVGLVLFCGPLFPQAVEDLRALLGVSAFGLGETAEPVPAQTPAREDPLQEEITWRSAPPIRARTLITNPNLLRTIVVSPEGQGIIQRARGREETQVLLVGGWLSHPSNSGWTEWAYYNYLIYRLIVDAAGVARPLSFSNYPYSPAPQRSLRWVIVGVGAVLIVGAAAIFYGAQRRLYLKPALADSWHALTALAAQPAEPEAWRQVGFHRPLAGLLTYLPVGLLLLLPTIGYGVYILPEVLLGGAQRLETWTTVNIATMALWILLDAGTGIAAVRHFSANQTHFPRRAPRYLQYYVWWQLLSGAAQAGLICILVVTALPGSGLAHLTYYLLALAALQLPGFLEIFALSFRARQRFDYEQFLNLFYALSLPLVQTGAILVLRPWHQASAAIGPGLAGSIGVATGLFLARALTFTVGAGLHWREGIPLRALFLPTFDGRTRAEMLAFGLPWAVSAAIPAVGTLLQLALLSEPLSSIVGNQTWQVLVLLAGGYEVLLVGLYRDLMPALTEAHVTNNKTLLRYYVSQAIRYGAWLSLFLFVVLATISEPLMGLLPGDETGASWLRMEQILGEVNLFSLLLLMLGWGALRWAAWLPDRMLEAAGRPGLIALLALVEHGARLGGALLLLKIWGAPGVLAAYLGALILRIGLGRVLAGHYLVRARVYVWQSLIAPAAASLLLHHLLRSAIALWEPATLRGGIGFSIVLLLPALLVYAFLTALLGGWDDGGLEELRRATKISGLGKPFAWALLLSVRGGARLSLLHGRFPMALYALAQEEARALTFAQRSI